MQIARVYYPVKTLGYGDRIGIWMVGCKHGCENCSNPELWDADPQREVPLQSLFRLFSQIKQTVDGVTISGGDPFEQVDDLLELVQYIKTYVTEDILVYTGYTIEELRERTNPVIDAILGTIAVLIDGKYIEELNDNLSLRGSSNQKVHILNPAFSERYEPLISQQREVQTVFYQDNLLSIGIPRKHYREDLQQGLDEYGIQFKRARKGQ
jgi:anaerobic ribonucleoside-triphosphate reductase activating protein